MIKDKKKRKNYIRLKFKTPMNLKIKKIKKKKNNN